LYVLLCTDNKIHITHSRLICLYCKPDTVIRVLIEQFDQAPPDTDHLLVKTFWNIQDLIYFTYYLLFYLVFLLISVYLCYVMFQKSVSKLKKGWGTKFSHYRKWRVDFV